MAKKDVPGNSVESTLQYQRTMLRAAEQLLRFENAAERAWDNDLYLRGMTVRFPDGVRGEYLVVMKADGPEGAQVAFVSSDTLLDAIRKAAASLENGSLKWKADQYAR